MSRIEADILEQFIALPSQKSSFCTRMWPAIQGLGVGQFNRKTVVMVFDVAGRYGVESILHDVTPKCCRFRLGQACFRRRYTWVESRSTEYFWRWWSWRRLVAKTNFWFTCLVTWLSRRCVSRSNEHCFFQKINDRLFHLHIWYSLQPISTRVCKEVPSELPETANGSKTCYRHQKSLL